MVLRFIILWFLFWIFFQILVQFATWFEFAMSFLTPFLFGKILISNKLYQLYWNIISVQIFGILSLLKMWFLNQLGENLFCQVRRWQGQAIFSTLERHYIGDDFVWILHCFHLFLLKYFCLSSKKSIFCSVQLGLSFMWVVILFSKLNERYPTW